jgi:hypothetical protein
MFTAGKKHHVKSVDQAAWIHNAEYLNKYTFLTAEVQRKKLVLQIVL